LKITLRNYSNQKKCRQIGKTTIMEDQKKYQKIPLATHQPGLIIILIDQSESMMNPYGNNMQKQEFAALAVNRCIYQIMNACQAGEEVRDRCHIAVIGYGKVTELLVGGKPSELGAKIKRIQVLKRKVPDGAGDLTEIVQKLPIWVESRAENGTPMDQGFRFAGGLIRAWIAEYPNNFPPIVINITDGEPNNPSQTEVAAQGLLDFFTSDGNALLLNAHIADSAAQEVKLPSDPKGLPSDFARLLFRISSVLPPPLLAAARENDFNPDEQARGFVMNAGAETLTKLLVFGSTPMRLR
jgi:uncharacterized protein YegL